MSPSPDVPFSAISSRLARWKGWKRLLRWDGLAGRWLVLLVFIFGVLYYGSYFHHSLNLSGEGGTTAVLAQRLLEGERPIVDTFLGYNVGWFAPITALFAVTGPSFTAMRTFFFAVCLLSAIIGAFMVWRISRSGLLALAVGLVLVLIPGMQFRNYMGFLGVFNQLVLLWAFLWPVSREGHRAWRMAVAGAALGVTYLIRIEVGLLITPVYLGLWVLYPLWLGRVRQRLPWTLVGGLGAVVMWGLVHGPVAWDAQRRGYAKDFWIQYENFPRYLHHLWLEKKQVLLNPGESSSRHQISADEEWLRVSTDADDANDLSNDGEASPSADAAAPTTEGADTSGPGASLVSPENLSSAVRSWRQRPPLLEMFTGIGQRERYFAAAVYVPALISAVWLVGGLTALLLAYWRRDEELRTDALTALTLTAGALALFPQYFFFRPDTPHITEFMIPFLPAVAGVMALLLRRWWRRWGIFSGLLAAAGVVAFGVTVWLHFGHAWPKGSSGSIAVRVANSEEFRGLNGVVARVSPEDARNLEALLEVITTHAGPEEFIATMPYAPTINFFTARRSYLWNLYMDDANRGAWFEQDQIARILRFRPPVLVIDNKEVNATEASRFRNWAPGLYAFIRRHYRLEGIYMGQEIFVLKGGPHPLPPPPKPSANLPLPAAGPPSI